MLIHEYSWHDVVFLAESSDGCRAANTGKNQQRGGFTGKTRKAADARLAHDGGTDEKAEAKTPQSSLSAPFLFFWQIKQTTLHHLAATISPSPPSPPPDGGGRGGGERGSVDNWE